MKSSNLIKLFAAVLLTLLLIFLAACSENPEEPVDISETESESEVVTDKESESEVESSSDTESENVTESESESESASETESESAKVTEKVYDTMLKSYGQELGVRSCGAVVDLLIAWHQAGMLPDSTRTR